MPPPMPAARELAVPEARGELIELALKLGSDLEGVVLPPGSKMPEIPLFGALRTDAFLALAGALVEVPLKGGQTLVTQGTTSPAMYLLAQGEVVVQQQQVDDTQVELARVGAPALIGEMSLLTAVPRRASVVSSGPGLAWRVDAATLKSLGGDHPELVARLGDLVKRRLLGNLLRQSNLLASVDDPERLLGAFRILTVPRATEIFPQGSEAPGLYLVLHGSAEVWTGGDTRVAVLSEGDAFGEMSLLTGEPTTAAVRMPDGGVLLHLPTEAWREQGGRVEGLARELEDLADVRRGELADLADPVEGTFEVVDESWLLE